MTEIFACDRSGQKCCAPKSAIRDLERQEEMLNSRRNFTVSESEQESYENSETGETQLYPESPYDNRHDVHHPHRPHFEGHPPHQFYQGGVPYNDGVGPQYQQGFPHEGLHPAHFEQEQNYNIYNPELHGSQHGQHYQGGVGQDPSLGLPPQQHYQHFQQHHTQPHLSQGIPPHHQQAHVEHYHREPEFTHTGQPLSPPPQLRHSQVPASHESENQQRHSEHHPHHPLHQQHQLTHQGAPHEPHHHLPPHETLSPLRPPQPHIPPQQPQPSEPRPAQHIPPHLSHEHQLPPLREAQHTPTIPDSRTPQNPNINSGPVHQPPPVSQSSQEEELNPTRNQVPLMRPDRVESQRPPAPEQPPRPQFIAPTPAPPPPSSTASMSLCYCYCRLYVYLDCYCISFLIYIFKCDMIPDTIPLFKNLSLDSRDVFI